MRKKFKMLIATCALVMGLGGVLSGCDAAASGPEPTYSSEEKYEVGMWIGVPSIVVEYDAEGKKTGNSRRLSDEEYLAKYQEIADAGFTVAMPAYENMSDGGNTPGSYNFRALKAAHDVGIKQIIGDARLREYLFSIAELEVDKAEAVAHVKEIIKPYLECEYADALYGFMIKDEPGANVFADYGKAQEVFAEAAPGLMFYVNLFPVVANGYQLSGVTTDSITYKDYLGRWFDKVRDNYVSYDHYPLYGDGVGGTSLEPSFLYNMDLMQTYAKDEGEGRKIWTFLQSITFGARNRALASKADASMQMFSAVAYGMEGVQWFCYCCPPHNDGATLFGNDALLDRNLEKTSTYSYVQAANLDVQALMPYMKNFEWKGVMLSEVEDYDDNLAYLDKSTNVIKSDKTLKSMTSTEDAFAGVFEDKEGREGYMVVNFTDPGRKLSNKVTLEFTGATKAIVVKDREKKVVSLKKGKYTLELECGGGAFVIPF